MFTILKSIIYIPFITCFGIIIYYLYRKIQHKFFSTGFQHYVIIKKMKPNFMMYKNEPYIITEVSKEYILYGYDIRIDAANNIRDVKIFGEHPNADKYHDFCLGIMKHKRFNKYNILKIEDMLCSYNLDNCYFSNINDIKYDKFDVDKLYKSKSKYLNYGKTFIEKMCIIFNFIRNIHINVYIDDD